MCNMRGDIIKGYKEKYDFGFEVKVSERKLVPTINLFRVMTSLLGREQLLSKLIVRLIMSRLES